MTTLEKISPVENLVSQFHITKSVLIGHAALREKAIGEFERQGIPNRKNEEWKYSDASALFKTELTFTKVLPKITKNEVEKFLIPNLEASVIVLINGIYSEELSTLINLPQEVTISSFESASKAESKEFIEHFSKYADITTDSFVALNTALANDGVFISVPDNVIVEDPIHIINIISADFPLVKGDKGGFLLQPRFLFIIGKNSQVKIIESIDTLKSNSTTICNSVAEIFIGERAKVQYYKLQNDCAGIHLISNVTAHQQINSHFDTNTVTLNGDWIRNNLNIVPNAEHCESHLNGLFITKGAQHIDNHTLVDHRKPNCQSNQLYKGILDEKSTGIFNGKIFVQRDAQKTNAYQSSKNILLSDDATINTKPQLEIYADDVKCSHGSTTGQLNEDAMFYLRSRGLSEGSAKNLLLFAFAGDVLEKIQLEPLKIYLEELVRLRLKK